MGTPWEPKHLPSTLFSRYGRAIDVTPCLFFLQAKMFRAPPGRFTKAD